jgi:flagellar biosynthesis/type III secretory pathway protein FliH
LQAQELQALIDKELYREARPLMITTYQRGKAEGKAEGYHEMALLLLEAKFGSLSSPTQQRIAEMTAEQLRQLVVELVKGNRTSLKDLQLEE